ncbi:DUF397 domain-containing protein [Nocardiopsis sp. NPDC006938]|uniref:DUF397 domain-containing protein n=1 Tax=Nocardiopsis sp. NPDC006938 TaxID=3364337 RepID=UPI0036A62175
MRKNDTETGEWFTSSYSSGHGQCVEVKHHGGETAVAVRDSVHPSEAALGFPATEWRAFLRPAAG